jgi:hypothetical protein
MYGGVQYMCKTQKYNKGKRYQDGHQGQKEECFWDLVNNIQQHSSEVLLVLNLGTGRITTQFHVVFDDLFTTVPSI